MHKYTEFFILKQRVVTYFVLFLP